ncbi:MAG TPA: energy transducer TonB [Ferruginibacter sp.]|nr:energy transducer TonB [Ferruginibacter sp.]
MKRKNVFSLKLLGTAVILSLAVISCNNNDTNEESTLTTDSTTTVDHTAVVSTDTMMTGPVDTAVRSTSTTGAAKPNPAKKGMKGKITITPPPPPPPAKADTRMEPDASGVYTNVETMPAYSGGNDAMQTYFNRYLEYPSQATNEGVEGTVMLSFIVDEKGKIRSPQVAGNNLGYGLDEEAIRVVNSMPKWTPAKVKGQNVKTRVTLPVRFVLE